MANSQVIYFHEQEDFTCKFLALMIYFLQFYHPCLVILYYSEVYLALKFAVNKDKQMKTKHRLSFLALLTTAVLGSGLKIIQVFGYDSSCKIHFTQVGNTAQILVQGVLYLVISAAMIVLKCQITAVRQVAGRKMGKSEKGVIIRLALFFLVMIWAFTASILEKKYFFSNTTLRLCCLYYQLTWISLAFPVIFGLSTKHFQNTVKKIFA